MDTKKDIYSKVEVTEGSELKSLYLSKVKDTDLYYITKKIEKIAAAIYIVMSVMPDGDPLLFAIKDRTVSLLSLLLSFNLSSSKNTGTLDTILGEMFQISAFLEVSHVSGYLSIMNFNLIHLEMLNAIKKINTLNIHPLISDKLLQHSFFNVEKITAAPMGGIHAQGENNKGHESVLYDRPDSHDGLNNIKDKGDRKELRMKKIISHFKNKDFLTVKDFLLVIRGVSEKTIQRELIALVGKGVLKKEGKRRWSRYSLLG